MEDPSFVKSLSILTQGTQRGNKDGVAFNLSHTLGRGAPNSVCFTLMRIHFVNFIEKNLDIDALIL